MQSAVDAASMRTRRICRSPPPRRPRLQR